MPSSSLLCLLDTDNEDTAICGNGEKYRTAQRHIPEELNFQTVITMVFTAIISLEATV
jgi:hypothetical protein